MAALLLGVSSEPVYPQMQRFCSPGAVGPQSHSQAHSNHREALSLLSHPRAGSEFASFVPVLVTFVPETLRVLLLPGTGVWVLPGLPGEEARVPAATSHCLFRAAGRTP